MKLFLNNPFSSRTRFLCFGTGIYLWKQHYHVSEEIEKRLTTNTSRVEAIAQTANYFNKSEPEPFKIEYGPYDVFNPFLSGIIGGMTLSYFYDCFRHSLYISDVNLRLKYYSYLYKNKK